MHPKYSIIIVTFKRDARLAETLARLGQCLAGRGDWELLLVDNNADGVDRTPVVTQLGGRVIVQSENTGCTGGRNAGIAEASGDYLLFLDDDALLVSEEPLRTLDGLFADLSIGAIAFRSFDGQSGEMDMREFPHTDKSKDPSIGFETFRFIGVGHALSAKAIEAVGPFRHDYFYGMEEFELSFRLMKAGYRIVYEPSLQVRHMKDAAGRLPKVAAVERHVINKIKTAWLHLPLGLSILSVSAWSVRAVVLSRGRANLPRMVSELAGWLRDNRKARAPMTAAVLARIAATGGSAWR